MITASDPWQGHNFPALFAIVLCGAAALLALLVYLCSRLTPRNLRSCTPPAVWRDASLLTAAASLALYLWGCLHVIFMDREEEGQACEVARPPDVRHLVGMRGDFVPLRLVCRAADGRDYSILIPHYVNPTLLVLLLLGLTCGAVSVLLSRRAQRIGQGLIR
ncbi:hypothetical protein ABT072_27525 [Streptomyces sp. NPDC002589]|uniref:hypothetical protein n=1 Tax=Streptomyces sp. NPDC002589 TaxID=3154420 RepID=UPI003324A8FE